MSRLTVKIGEYYCSPDNETSLKPLYDKLGQLENLEDELGCPLDVVFKAIEDGIVIMGDLKENGDMTL